MVVTVFAAALIGPVSGLAGAPRPPLNAAVATAKTNLLSCVAPLARGTASTPKDREVVEAKIDALLAAVKEVAGDTGGSTMDFAVCPEISGTWQLEYTTEAELLGLMKNPKTVVTQSIDMVAVGAESRLQNFVGFSGGFCDGWEFTVDSSISGQGKRSSFEFNAATLAVTPALKIPLPPVGKGWFDNLYVDETIRVNRESRGNTVLYTRRAT